MSNRNKSILRKLKRIWEHNPRADFCRLVWSIADNPYQYLNTLDDEFEAKLDAILESKKLNVSLDVASSDTDEDAIDNITENMAELNQKLSDVVTSVETDFKKTKK